MGSYIQYDNFAQGVQPADTTSAAVSTQWIDMRYAHEIAFLAMFGSVTGTSTIDNLTITVEASTVNASTSGTAVAFKYRVSGAVTANTWTAPADATASGYNAVLAAITGTSLLVEVDPAEVQAAKADARWLKLEITKSATITACVAGVAVITDPRYKQETMNSVT